MLNVIMVSVIKLSVIMLSVIRLSVIMLSGIALIIVVLRALPLFLLNGWVSVNVYVQCGSFLNKHHLSALCLNGASRSSNLCIVSRL